MWDWKIQLKHKKKKKNQQFLKLCILYVFQNLCPCSFIWIISPWLVHCQGCCLWFRACHFLLSCSVFVLACCMPRLCPHLGPRFCRVSSQGRENVQPQLRRHQGAQPATFPVIRKARNNTDVFSELTFAWLCYTETNYYLMVSAPRTVTHHARSQKHCDILAFCQINLRRDTIQDVKCWILYVYRLYMYSENQLQLSCFFMQLSWNAL